MYIEFDIILKPFVVVFFICWFAFSLLIMFRPYAWFEYQNKLSGQYGYQWTVTDEQKFLKTHRRVGMLLIVFGAIFVVILAGGFIII
jgi:hypothetical protein